MNKLEKRLIATALLIPVLLVTGYLIATNQSSGWFFWGLIIFGIIDLWFIYLLRDRLPEPQISFSLFNVNIPEGRMIANIWTNRNGFVALHIDSGSEKIGCGIFPVVAGKTESFDVTFRENTTGTVFAEFYKKYPKCDEFSLAKEEFKLQ